MSAVHDYKRLENNLVQKVKDSASAVGNIIARYVKAFWQFITRRYTIVLVPHSEKRVYNLHITVLSTLCFIFIFVGVIGGFFLYGANFNTASIRSPVRDNRLRDTQASLDQIRDEVTLLLREARNFEPALANTISLLGPNIGGFNHAEFVASGDLSSFLGITEIPEGSFKEVEDLRRIREYLAAATNPIQEIGVLLDSQSALLTEIPSIWPIQGGIGHITLFFGQTRNPFTGLYYIHRGIDISNYRQGDPIVATADGQVVMIEYDHGGFGNNLIIRHKHGFYTRYAHMHSFMVRTGQRVQQGDVIGFVGNTGLTTGPHLHYEVHIGSDVVDPFRYLSIRSSIARTNGR